MAKSIAKSCPLCLSVNDPVDMLPVTMAHSTPAQSAPMFICRLCVIQIMKSTLESDVVDPREVFGDVEAYGYSAGDSGNDSPAAALGDSLVPEDLPGGAAIDVDRREPEDDAGGARDAKEPEKN